MVIGGAMTAIEWLSTLLGIACVALVGITATWLRSFWTYDNRTDEYAVREREVRQAREAADQTVGST